jgi:translation initiation factor IF-3
VRLIDANGHQLGVVTADEAVKLAEGRGLDLVEVAPEAVPPVCRIMDYGKYKYHMHKKEKEARKKHQEIIIKEIKLRPRIDPHDFGTKANHVERFLKEGDKVKVTIMFRGRENTHQDLGRKLLDKMTLQLAELAAIESPPKVEGNNMFMIMAPKRA